MARLVGYIRGSHKRVVVDIPDTDQPDIAVLNILESSGPPRWCLAAVNRVFDEAVVQQEDGFYVNVDLATRIVYEMSRASQEIVDKFGGAGESTRR